MSSGRPRRRMGSTEQWLRDADTARWKDLTKGAASNHSNERERSMTATTNLWPGIDQALAHRGAVHDTEKGRRVTIDFYFHDADVTYAALRTARGPREIGAQIEPSLVLNSAGPEGPDSALRWFLVELAEKVRAL